MSQNMAWDGWFHAVTWLITLVGVFMLWNSAKAGTVVETAQQLVGELLFGWGAFNLTEGLVDHHLLGIHHVRDLPYHVPMYDWMFLGFGGIGLLVVGWLLMRPVRHRLSA